MGGKGKMRWRWNNRPASSVGIDPAQLAFPGMAVAIDESRMRIMFVASTICDARRAQIGPDRGNLRPLDQDVALGEIATLASMLMIVRP